MSTRVSYKGAQIAEVGTQQTKTLLTAGKYCEDDFTLANDDNPTAEDNDVIFIDYDGTIRYSYSAEEFLALTALPPNPVHEGLTAQGWNWTLADAKAYVNECRILVIGQQYITTNGKTRFVFVGPSKTELCFSQSKSEGATFTLDGNSWTVQGTRQLVTNINILNGRHELFVDIDDDCTFRFGFGQTGGNIFSSSGIPGYIKCICKEINFGKNIAAINALTTNCFRDCKVDRITFPEYFAFGDYTYLFSGFMTNALIIPMNSSINSYGAEDISAPLSLSPYTVSGEYSSFRGVKTRLLPIGKSGYRIRETCYEYVAAAKIAIPSNVSQLLAAAFRYSHFGEMRFTRQTPPTAAASSVFLDMTIQYCILVPFSGLAAYLTATNYPNPATYTYLGFATYASGAALPTQDGTAAYNVTWYASKADAIAETNAITEGNGKEIYCRYAAV